jgi:PAS domain S-box-containing protein
MTIRNTPQAASASLARIPNAALGALLEHSTDFIGLATPDGQVLFVNAAGQQLVGLDEPAQVHTTIILDYVASAGQKRFETEIWPAVLQQGHWEGEIPFRHFKTGTAIPMQHAFLVIKDEESHQSHTLAMISRSSTTSQRIETAVRDIAEGISAATGPTFFRSLMQHLAKTLAVDYAFVGAVSPEDGTRVRTVAVCADGQMAPNFEYDLRDTPCKQVTSGSLCVYPDRIQSHFPHDRLLAEMGIEGYVGTPLINSQERVIGLMVVLSRRLLDHPDLCVATLRIFATRAAAELERQQAEDAVRASEQRWRTMFENAAIGIALVDTLGHPIQSNPALQRMLDYTADELHRMSFVAFTHPEDVAKDWALVREVFTGQRDHYQIEKRYIRKDGQVLWGHLTVSAIRDADGSCPFVIGMLEDITERQQAEEQLRATSEQLRALMASLRSAREQEGVRIAREIHDELGSALTSLKWDLEEIDTTLDQRADQSQMPALRGKIGTMVERLEATMQVVRRIAADLRPHLLDDLGLETAIEWHMQQFQDRTGILCQYEGVGHPLDVDQEQSTAIFRIMQEALTNVLRHAHATRVDVTLEEEGAALVLTIRDNGRGITDDEQSGPHTLGLLGMRERAYLIEGRVDITGVEGQGTTVTLRVPRVRAQQA